MMRRVRVHALAGTFALAASSACFAQSIVDLGTLPGGTWNYGGLLSDDGAVCAGSAGVAGGNSRAYRWTAATGMANLGVTPGADHSYGYGLSGNGLVVVGAGGGAAYDTACRWTQATGLQSLGSLAPGQPSFAFAASYDGSIVVGDGYYASGTQRAFRWTAAGGMQALAQTLPGTLHSVGTGISSDGSTVIGYCYNNAPALIYPTACRWNTAGVITSLGVLAGSTESVAEAASADGSVVVGYCADGAGGSLRAFRWTQATGMQELAPAPGMATPTAGSVSGDGTVITGYGIVGADVRACLWTAGGVQDLTAYLQSRGVDTTGWVLRSASISASGNAFSGWGVHNGVDTTWHVKFGCAGSPTITGQPVDQTVTQGAAVSFTVGASGAGLTYLWSHGNVPIVNAVAATFTIAAAAPADAGGYSCTVTNSCGSGASLTAILTVSAGCDGAEIIGQPADVTTCPGSLVHLAVEVGGTGPFEYQWRKDGIEIAGANGHEYEIDGARSADSGFYDCIVTNDCGDTASDAASVSVCGSDFDCNGFVNGEDFDAFVWEFYWGNAAADVDGNGFVNGEDFDGFVIEFEAGC